MGTNRYSTPLKYTNGKGESRTTTLHFELSPTEFADWTIENAFEANELQASMIEIQNAGLEESRRLTQDEIRTMMYVVKVLAQIAAGRPSEDGEYFIKDPNWVSSYAYRAFREFLFMNPKAMNEFLMELLDNDTIEQFISTLDEANKRNAAELPDVPLKSLDEMTEEELRAALANRTTVEKTPQPAPSTDPDIPPAA